ncbi:hypothetical protein BO78DRAFT_273137, partial [Aspergillus sclerotiicarbonarius CBS 121057]
PYHETAPIQTLIHQLNLTPHIEGGYFSETDRDSRRITLPSHPNAPDYHHHHHHNSAATSKAPHRSLSTHIFYLLTPHSPIGAFHRNRSRTIHTLHRGRGVYVILRNRDSNGSENGTDCDRDKHREKNISLETFIVGQDTTHGERLQWIVEGGDYKATFLIPDGHGHGDDDSGGLLISETVIPGFEYSDHEFLRREDLKNMVDGKEFGEVEWLL